MGEDNIHHKKTPKHGAANTAFSLSGAKRALVDNIKDWALVKLGAGGGGEGFSSQVISQETSVHSSCRISVFTCSAFPLASTLAYLGLALTLMDI